MVHKKCRSRVECCVPLTDGEHDGALDPVHRGEGRGGPQAGQLLAPRLQPAVAEAVAHEGGLGDVSEHHLAGQAGELKVKGVIDISQQFS